MAKQSDGPLPASKRRFRRAAAVGRFVRSSICVCTSQAVGWPVGEIPPADSNELVRANPLLFGGHEPPVTLRQNLLVYICIYIYIYIYIYGAGL